MDKNLKFCSKFLKGKKGTLSIPFQSKFSKKESISSAR